jgi:uncharacterized coiled-coil protein SlyX
MKTVEERLEDLEARVTALENAVTGTGNTTTESEPDTRLDQVVTVVERFLESVGIVYEGAGDDLAALKALREPIK